MIDTDFENEIWQKRNWDFPTNSDFLIPLSLNSNAVDPFIAVRSNNL